MSKNIGNYQENKKFINNYTKPNQTNYKGVSKDGKRFQAKVCLRISGKTVSKYLGTFDTAEEAYKERVRFIKDLL